MSWLEIVGAIGGSAGIVALIKVGIDVYNAKSNRTKVDLGNMEQMLKDSMERYDKLETKFDEFQKKSHEYVEGLRGRIVMIEVKSQKQEERINNMEKVINLAWRCKYPDNVSDCPVIKEYEKRHLCENCEDCTGKK
jgi:chromosome segregation ATPase